MRYATRLLLFFVIASVYHCFSSKNEILISVYCEVTRNPCKDAEIKQSTLSLATPRRAEEAPKGRRSVFTPVCASVSLVEARRGGECYLTPKK